MYLQRRSNVFTTSIGCRQIFSKTGVWDAKYTNAHRDDLEKFWMDSLNRRQMKKQHDRPKYYVLSMFPYPSGKLHMGHVRVYTISDAMAHYKRLLGHDVIHPMGWDAFGLPAENAAIEQNVDPAAWTQKNIATMKKQLMDLGCQFDWNREISTCDESYYRWTQLIFIKLFRAGLVYQKMAPVNWDPVDKTVLADEQVDEGGRSWRSGAKVEKIPLKQWYIRTTAYSKSLFDGLSAVDEDLWRDVVSLQKEWIGECDGARFDFKLQSSRKSSEEDEELLASPLSIFTKHPECMWGVSHVVLSHLHPLNLPRFYDTTTDACRAERLQKLNVSAINPFSGSSIPVFVSMETELDGGMDHHVGIPSVDDGDRLVAVKLSLPFEEVVSPVDGKIISSGRMSGLSVEDARSAILKQAQEMSVGGHVTSGRARDWLISRQRYWGTPIPIVHCPKYGAVPVSEEDLPVLLPRKIPPQPSSSPSSFHNDTKHDIKSPLANNTEWLKAKCSKCDCEGFGSRETDTMDTFVDSSWYFLRYLDPRNQKLPFDPQVTDHLLPVDLYIGGKEHATMHLYYARFVQHFLFNHKLTPTKEPFKNLLTQGMVLGQSFRLSGSGRYLRPENVEEVSDKFVEKGTGLPVTVEFEKMSKSKFNGVDPQETLEEFGRDATRICILSNSSPKSDRQWSNDVFLGVLRWQRKLWGLVHKFISQRNNAGQSCCADEGVEDESCQVDDMRNRMLLQVEYHMEKTFLLNTAISRMQMMTTSLTKCSDDVIANSPAFERALSDLVIMLSPIAPSFASELWAGIASVNHINKHYDWNSDVLEQKYPVADDNFCLPMSVKVNDKLVTEVRLPMVHSQTESRLSPSLAWQLISEDTKFIEFVSSLSLKGEESEDKRSPDKSSFEGMVARKNLNTYGNSKVEFEIFLNKKSPKEVKRTKLAAAK